MLPHRPGGANSHTVVSNMRQSQQRAQTVVTHPPVVEMQPLPLQQGGLSGMMTVMPEHRWSWHAPQQSPLGETQLQVVQPQPPPAQLLMPCLVQPLSQCPVTGGGALWWPQHCNTGPFVSVFLVCNAAEQL